MRRAALIIASLAILSACAERTRFTDVEALLRTAPDSALYLLDEIDTAALGAADKALYTLLCMDAEVEAFGSVIITPRSRIRDAARYYEWDGDRRSLARMWSVLAREQSAKGNDAVASEYWSYAAELLEGSSRDYESRLRTARLRTMIAVLFLFLALVIGYNYHRLQKEQSAREIEHRKAEAERSMAVAEDLRARLSAASLPQGRLSDSHAVLERLCEQYYVYEGTDNLQPKILREVRQVIEELRTDPAQLESMLDRGSGGLMRKFREQNPGIKEDDARLFCFLASGLSSTTISTLMEKDKQYIYNRIYRLKGRIAASSAPDKELFLKAVGK